MARARGRRFAPRFRRSPSNFNWDATIPVAGVTVASATKVILAQFVVATGVDEVIERIVGNLTVAPASSAASQTVIGAVGAIVVSADAAAAGVASIPGPVSDAASQWMFYQMFQVEFVLHTAVGAEILGVTQSFDNRSRRVLRDNEVLIFVGEQPATGDSGVVLLQARVLGRIRGT